MITMANRKLYSLEKCGDDAVIVYRTDGHGRQGVVFDTGFVRREYSPGLIPKYIIAECLAILAATPAEIERGYNLAGVPCRADRNVEPLPVLDSKTLTSAVRACVAGNPKFAYYQLVRGHRRKPVRLAVRLAKVVKALITRNPYNGEAEALIQLFENMEEP